MIARKDIRSRWLVGAAAGALGIAGVALALPAHAATAVTFYVSPSGSDSNPGTSASPWLTLQHAANQVAAGDNVSVAAGAYKGFQLTTSGTAGQRITFSANAGVIINAANSSTADGIN